MILADGFGERIATSLRSLDDNAAMGWKEKAELAKQKAQEAADRAVNSELAQRADVKAVAAAAADASGVANKNGDVKKWRVAKAAANPVGVGRRVAAAAAKETIAQRRKNSGSDSAERLQLEKVEGAGMRLVVSRSQSEKKGMLGGHKGVSFNLTTRLDFTEDEHQLLDHYKMWEYTVLTRGGVPLSLRDLVAGDSQTVENVEILLRNEEVVKDALDAIPPLLEVLRSFGGDEQIEYPRDKT